MILSPRGHQREVLYLSPQGHHVVIGAAGSGKSTVAVLRSSYLAGPGLDHAGRVLLATFTNSLIAYLRQLAESAGPRVDILTFHTVAKDTLSTVPRLYYSQGMNELQSAAIDTFKKSQPDHRLASRPKRFFTDEFAWIAGHGFYDKTSYINAERIGRGSARLLREDRATVFDIYMGYRQARDRAGYEFDLQDAGSRLLQGLKNREVRSPYRHVIIDEAQDFAPEVLRALSLMAEEDGSVTVFADYAQQIYGRRMSWRSAGLRVSKIWNLEGNYRNTRQIAKVASAIASSPDFEAEESLLPSEITAEGPIPHLAIWDSQDLEDAWLARQSSVWASGGTVAILCRTNPDCRNLLGLLPSAVPLNRNTERIGARGTYVGTIHQAKGLEFDSVIIARCSIERLPDPVLVDAHGIEEATAEDLRLLYVGVTRARRRLAISCHGTPSKLIPLTNDLFHRIGQ